MEQLQSCELERLPKLLKSLEQMALPAIHAMDVAKKLSQVGLNGAPATETTGVDLNAYRRGAGAMFKSWFVPRTWLTHGYGHGMQW